MASLFLVVTLLTLLRRSNADMPSPTFKIIGTSTLVPPYGTGPATYYASSVKDDRIGTVYAITCVADAAVTSTITDADPCQTKVYGSDPQIFFSGSSNWYILRSQPSTSVSGFPIQTDCNPFSGSRPPGIVTRTFITPTLPTCNALPTPLECKIKAQDRDGFSTVEMCSMGLKQQQVLMVESLPTSTSKTMPNPATFTDVGRTVTEAPIPTITLFKEPDNLGTKGKEVRSGVLWLALAAVALLAMG